MSDWIMWLVFVILITSFGVAGIVFILIIYWWYQIDVKQNFKKKQKGKIDGDARKL